MKRVTGILLLVLTCVFTLRAQVAETQLAQHAQALYQQKQYDSAAYYYEAALAKAPATASLHYNLGNAYYKANKVGPAVLSYERALFYDPANSAAADNLLLTKSRVANQIQSPRDIFFVRWWQAMSRGDHATAWAIFCVLLFLVTLATILLQRSGKMNRQLPVQLYFVLGFILSLGLMVAYNAADNAAHSDKAVVMSDNTPFSDAPGKGKSQSLIPEGVTVEMGETNKDWVAVTLPDGRRGWIQRNWLTPVQIQRP